MRKGVIEIQGQVSARLLFIIINSLSVGKIEFFTGLMENLSLNVFNV